MKWGRDTERYKNTFAHILLSHCHMFFISNASYIISITVVSVSRFFFPQKRKDVWVWKQGTPKFQSHYIVANVCFFYLFLGYPSWGWATQSSSLAMAGKMKIIEYPQKHLQFTEAPRPAASRLWRPSPHRSRWRTRRSCRPPKWWRAARTHRRQHRCLGHMAMGP